MTQSNLLTVYSFLHVAVVLNGKEVVGLWEGDDAVIVAPRTDVGSEMVGVDGAGIMSISADRSVLITLKLQGTSPTHRFLENRHIRMRGGGSQTMPISIRDTATGEGGNARECLIKQAPDRAFGMNAASRDWVLWAQCWEPNRINYT